MNQKEIIDIFLKITVTEMKNDCFDELISSLGMAEKRISDFEDISIETSKAEKQRGQRWRKKNRLWKTTEWERLEISSRKSEIPKEHFMQRWAR